MDSNEKNQQRRELLKKGVVGGLGVLALSQLPKLSGLEALAETGTGKNELAAYPEELKSSDPVIRMQEELRKSIQKPTDQISWIMVIDLKKCTGCSTCTVACEVENGLPPGVVYRPVIDEEIGTYPNVGRRFMPRPCMQCEHPPCVDVCPVAATFKREDGIVEIDYDKCIGCRYCITACPYGARTFDWGEYHTDNTPELMAYELQPKYEYQIERTREKINSPIGNTRKCSFCLHRVYEGILPACVTTCLGRATYFGDKNDPESLVSQLIASPRVMKLKEELGTDPSVYYLT